MLIGEWKNHSPQTVMLEGGSGSGEALQVARSSCRHKAGEGMRQIMQQLLIPKLFHPDSTEKVLYEEISHLVRSEIKSNKMTEDSIQGFPLLLLSLASIRETHGKRQ